MGAADHATALLDLIPKNDFATAAVRARALDRSVTFGLVGVRLAAMLVAALGPAGRILIRAVGVDSAALRLTPDLAEGVRLAASLAADHGRDHDLARSLDRTLAKCAGLHIALAELSAVADGASRNSVRVSRLAGSVAALAVRCLPGEHRARYGEELCADLYVLAGVSRRAQWGYAIRELRNAFLLRRELRHAERVAARQRGLG